MRVRAVYDFQNVFDNWLLILNTAGQCLHKYIKTYTYAEILNQKNFLIRLWLWSSRGSSRDIQETVWANDTWKWFSYLAAQI